MEQTPSERAIEQTFDGIAFVWIPPGSFEMGSESGSRHEKPVHRVEITTGFWLGKYPVIQEEWERVMGSNPSGFVGARRPVERVSWDDVQEFIARLNRTAGGRVYRLPTEAEWEYACRAGTETAYYYGDDEAHLGSHAWYQENSGEETHPVGQLTPNAWGLYDMLGNVWEWCQDWYDEDYYRQSPTRDPQGQSTGVVRLFRGGSWCFSADHARCAYRSYIFPFARGHVVGFRLARIEG